MLAVQLTVLAMQLTLTHAHRMHDVVLQLFEQAVEVTSSNSKRKLSGGVEVSKPEAAGRPDADKECRLTCYQGGQTGKDECVLVLATSADTKHD